MPRHAGLDGPGTFHHGIIHGRDRGQIVTRQIGRFSLRAEMVPDTLYGLTSIRNSQTAKATRTPNGMGRREAPDEQRRRPTRGHQVFRFGE
jgi:hypothetical protein